MRNFEFYKNTYPRAHMSGSSKVASGAYISKSLGVARDPYLKPINHNHCTKSQISHHMKLTNLRIQTLQTCQSTINFTKCTSHKHHNHPLNKQ